MTRCLSVVLILALAACSPRESTSTTTVSTETVTSVYVPVPMPASSSPAGAMGTPSFDCAKALQDDPDGIERVICGDTQLVDLDNELARLYFLADASAGASRETLQRLQKGWLDQRRSTCTRTAEIKQCLVNAYAERIHDLRSAYAATRDDTGTSHGPDSWRCPGSDLPLSTTFINGYPSIAYIRWGGQSVILPQVISGSGGRYAGDSYELWTKGSELMWTVPQKVMVTCARVG
ncbi:hypothetical protein ABI_06520 [Asticcacaulis biprosthecium C19]|uniref:Lysozyme inhibitor LprI N-terminal domain-containing protein n=1 Tax=Asticcacaulis biprosthecium C19 TaxID=715226 RepID=F4QKZ5_9CAUL|nr:MliC family protein [Asticcacaulis biprosthecium]EGF92218.1 hypothetical protein ABI_06520 [Asticcacaulis biprosthecium C19]